MFLCDLCVLCGEKYSHKLEGHEAPWVTIGKLVIRVRDGAFFSCLP